MQLLTLFTRKVFVVVVLISTLKKRKMETLVLFLNKKMFLMLEVSEAPGDTNCTINSNQIREIV